MVIAYAHPKQPMFATLELEVAVLAPEALTGPAYRASQPKC
jgi:hypothetical protein